MKRKTMKKCLGIVLAALIASSIGAVPVAAEEVPEANEPVAEEEVPAEAETVLESEVVETEAVLMPEGTLSPAPGSGMFAGMTPNGTITEFVDPWGTTSCFWSLAYEGTGTYESITADTVNKTITFKGLVSSSELHIFSASEGYTYIFEGTNTINAIAIEAFQANPCPNITLQCKEGSTLTTSTWYDVCDQYLTLASGTTSDPAPRVNLQAVTFTGAATQSGGDSGDSGDSSSGDSGDSSSGDSGDSSSGDSGDSSSGDDSSAGDTSDASSNDNASSDEVTSPATAEIINGVFQNALGRDADEDGLKYWTKQIEDEGKTVADLIRGVIGSAEFEAKKLSDGDYVDTLY
ncbi:MAG: DUF4214 domain-containing protein, partial [Lachnospiraceae bacterium]|nr:DUF4214 domain-containing protein [Lachnospiraceae bacterium]